MLELNSLNEMGKLEEVAGLQEDVFCGFLTEPKGVVSDTREYPINSPLTPRDVKTFEKIIRHAKELNSMPFIKDVVNINEHGYKSVLIEFYKV